MTKQEFLDLQDKKRKSPEDEEKIKEHVEEFKKKYTELAEEFGLDFSATVEPKLGIVAKE